jgi:lipid II:glycine glycyltransferase (peptidoglycan interpeptide bridge formation enzyme)
MDIKEELDKEAFNKVSIHPLQSWEWGEFRKKWGNEVVRLPYGQLTLHKIPLFPFKIGMFIKGPTPTKKMLDDLKALAKKENLIFIKLEPNVVKNEKLITLLKRNGAVKGKTLFTPSTFWIDLTKSEEELLASFHPKTRYNIRVAQKKGVTVVEDNSKEAFKKYLALTKETVKRQGFYAHTERYHRLMWETLNPAGIARLLTARYKGEIITCWIVFVWKNFLYYPYGASTEKYKNVMANNLMMWEAIRFGKSLGLTTFDLWGREEGKGFTRFKEGYNPKVVEFLGTWDMVTSPFYRLYIFSEYLRWIILRAKSKLIKPTF